MWVSVPSVICRTNMRQSPRERETDSERLMRILLPLGLLPYSCCETSILAASSTKMVECSTDITSEQSHLNIPLKDLTYR